MSRYATTLRLAAKLIESEDRWTMGVLAARDGHRVPPTHPDADCFCVEGAICNVLGVNTYSEADVPTTIIRAIHEESCRLLAKRDVENGRAPHGYGERLNYRRRFDQMTATPYLVNDDLGHAAVLDLLERAARRLELYHYGQEAA